MNLLAAVLWVLGWATIPAATATTARLSSWMGDIPGVWNRTLQQLTLPGTHDSGSYSVLPVLVGEPPLYNELLEAADALGLPVGQVIDGWARSQDVDLYGQFVGGIRYVDVRACVYCDPTNNSCAWHTHHSVVLGTQLDDLLNDTASFLRDYPTELVVLEITHFEPGNDNATSEEMAELVNLIEKYLGPYLVPHALGLNQTVGAMVSNGYRALVTVDSFDKVVTSAPGLWPGATIINTFANDCNLTVMEGFNAETAAEFAAAGRAYPHALFKMSWTLTPDAECILAGAFSNGTLPNTLIELGDTANAQLAQWLQATQAANPGLDAYPTLGNILIIDHFETSPIVAVVSPPTFTTTVLWT